MKPSAATAVLVSLLGTSASSHPSVAAAAMAAASSSDIPKKEKKKASGAIFKAQKCRESCALRGCIKFHDSKA
jgi:hypothetical protein